MVKNDNVWLSTHTLADRCQIDNGKCGEHANCTVVDGKIQCNCLPGFEKIDHSCLGTYKFILNVYFVVSQCVVVSICQSVNV